MLQEVHDLNEELCELVTEVWQEFVELRKCDDEFIFTNKKGEEFTQKISDIVVPTIPILYFGDHNAYENSRIKIVTVSLNPSDMEFKHNKDDDRYSFFRFPAASDLCGKDDLNEKDIEKYINSLNSYFKNVPYGWFNDNRRDLFDVLNVSYYDGVGKDNRAVHIDLATSIPTDPTWAGLSEDTKQLFIARDKNKWRKILKVLSPDIILLSLDTKYIREVDDELYKKLNKNEEKYKESGNIRNKRFSICDITLENEKNVKVLNIITANKAFQFTSAGKGYEKFAALLSDWSKEISQQRKS